MPIPGMNREQMMEKKRLNKPYVSGAGPLPNDEFGDGHRQVNPAYSRRTNMNIANEGMSDGNLSGIQGMYGTEGVPPAPYTEGPGLGPQTEREFGARRQGLDQSMQRLRETFGEDQAMTIIDELLRISASEDVNGPMAPPSNTTMPGGEYGASGFPAPDFGSGQPYTTGPTGDGDLAALEQTMGYPVMANKTSGPVRNMPGQKRLKRR